MVVGPIVPLCPFWCGNVWNCMAADFDGSISSRKPNKWNVAYGQISSSTPENENISLIFFHYSQPDAIICGSVQKFFHSFSYLFDNQIRIIKNKISCFIRRQTSQRKSN